MSEDKHTIVSAISKLKSRLKEIDEEREGILKNLESLQQKLSLLNSLTLPLASSISSQSTLHEKISLFRALFKGREDVYPKLWISKKTGAKGYSPVCDNEWISVFAGSLQ